MSTNKPLTSLDKFFQKDVEDPSGNTLPLQPIIQFVGAGVSCTDDPTNDRTIVTFSAAVNPTSHVSTTTTLTTQTSIDADTSGGAFTLTMPAAPADGLVIRVSDAAAGWNTHNLTVSGNSGQTVENPGSLGSYASTQTLTIKGSSVDFQWIARISGWKVV